MNTVGPVKGYLPFRVRVQRQDFRVALGSGETALLAFRDVVNNAYSVDKRNSGFTATHAPPAYFDVPLDNTGVLAYSEFSIVMRLQDGFPADKHETVKAKVVEFLNRFIEVYRIVFKASEASPLAANHPLLRVLPAPGSGSLPLLGFSPVVVQPWKVSHLNAEVQGRLNAGWKVPIEQSLLLDAHQALGKNDIRLAIFQACVSVETAIDRHLVAKAPPKHSYAPGDKGFLFDGKRPRDVFEKYGDLHQKTCTRPLEKERKDLWEELEYLKGVRNSIAHTGEAHYVPNGKKYYNDRHLTPKAAITIVDQKLAERLLRVADAILDWLGAEEPEAICGSAAPGKDGTPHLKEDFPKEMMEAGVAKLMSGDASGGIRLLREALTIRPDYPRAQFNLGIALGDQAERAAEAGQAEESGKLLRESIDCFRSAIVLEPEWPDAYGNLAVALLRLGAAGDAAQVLEELVRIKLTDAQSYCLLGRAYDRQGNNLAALAALAHSAWLQIGDGEALFRLAQIAAQQGDTALATQSLASAVKTDARWRVEANKYPRLLTMLSASESR